MPKLTGVRTGRQRKTAAAVAQRQVAGSMSRPGRRPLSPAEQQGRAMAVRIGRALNPRVLKLVARRLAVSESIQAIVERELLQPTPDSKKIAELSQAAQTNMDLVSIYREVADRFGYPRRTVQDVRLEDQARSPIVLADDGQRETWRKAEEEHAARGRDTGGGNGHDDVAH